MRKRYFLIPTLLFGLIIVFITPPCQTPDEKNHFYRAIHISEGNIVGERLGNRLGGQIPLSADSFAMAFMFLKGEYTHKTSCGQLFSFIYQQSNLENKAYKDFNNTGFYSPVGYLHSAIAILVAKSLGLTSFLALVRKNRCLFTLDFYHLPRNIVFEARTNINAVFGYSTSLFCSEHKPESRYALQCVIILVHLCSSLSFARRRQGD